jgi:pimeloyl-ACP methyl ester carboxylesterase
VTETPKRFDGPNGAVAYDAIDGRGPTIVWFGGFASDMTGTKAQHLAGWARSRGRSFLRFDYSGHGASEGRFEDGCISDWRADALAAIDALTEGPLALVGSSMGAWIASLVALSRPERMLGAIFIAPAPDFTEALIWDNLDHVDRARLMKDGRIVEPSPYGGMTFISMKLVEDGRRHLLLGGSIAIDCPVRILHGMNDRDIPYAHALRFAAALASTDVEIILVKAGDHRLSRPQDLALLTATVEKLAR